MFVLADYPLQRDDMRTLLADHAAGGYVTFEGWVRDHNEGRDVRELEYEAYPELCAGEAQRIMAEARAAYEILDLRVVHRVGRLGLGELAVWVAVCAAHRGPAFAACQYLIDEVKVRLPIWKKEYYLDGDSGWVNCAHCAAHAHTHVHRHT